MYQSPFKHRQAIHLRIAKQQKIRVSIRAQEEVVDMTQRFCILSTNSSFKTYSEVGSNDFNAMRCNFELAWQSPSLRLSSITFHNRLLFKLDQLQLLSLISGAVWALRNSCFEDSANFMNDRMKIGMRRRGRWVTKQIHRTHHVVGWMNEWVKIPWSI